MKRNTKYFTLKDVCTGILTRLDDETLWEEYREKVKNSVNLSVIAEFLTRIETVQKEKNT